MDKKSLVTEVVYNNIECKTKINGFLSAPLSLICEVRQGNPLSILLCIIAAEVLAMVIGNEIRIKGGQTWEHEAKVVNFATDKIIHS